MDLLKAELERKKQRTSELVAKAGGEKGGRRFVRRGEAARLEKEERLKNQADLIRLREEKKRKREEEERKKEEEEERRKKRSAPVSVKEKKKASDAAKEKERAAAAAAANEAAATAQEDEVPAKEAKARLRALCLPITLFGETQAQRSARLLLAEEDKGHHQDDFTLADGHNVNNEFLGNVSSDLTGSHLDAATGRNDETAAGDGKAGDDSDDDDDDDDETGAGARAARQATRTAGGGETGAADKGDGVGGEGGAAAAAASGGGAGGEDAADKEAGLDGEVKEMERNKLVRTFFRGLLKEWEMDLNARPDHVKRTVQGKLETKTQKQAKDYMRPLFKLCKQKALPDGILNNLVTMINFMKEGEFVRANDIYILTAIGNAPWPIGLTMVGIHERSGRERISSKNVAHIMNNEAQRKYLVSVKRLMTYLQDKRPDIAPSKKVR
ncbi:conserved unknown protein [Ectocarpus siliculosus]|uniref:Pre-mRNA-splicing factor 18 n=1 Tax=Ectocarpus siliculosus TaxID=2880 RepID=D7FIP2_ECTSI|nr:conserved unknown protein [Ectocarpus siliculosus]|eukprot:CBJ28860.1 conserved unknown protein [Ectocarpus siliculosus]